MLFVSAWSITHALHVSGHAEATAKVSRAGTAKAGAANDDAIDATCYGEADTCLHT